MVFRRRIVNYLSPITDYVAYVRLSIFWREEEVGVARAPISHALYMDPYTWTPPYLDLLARAASSVPKWGRIPWF